VPLTWYRPYTPGKARWVIAVWELIALMLFHRTTVDLFSLGPHTRTHFAAILAAIWACGCWRLAQMGLYTSEVGVQVRGLLTCRTIPWADISRIVLDHVDYDVGKLRIPAGRVVAIELMAGGRVNSTLWADGVDFKFRPALFQKTYDSLRRTHLSKIGDFPSGGKV
jgi:hypothetical protein